ncbi:Glycerophosphoryl diester phosphodiesterase [Thiomonas arsenitoxydans]|uniref:Glycerophosphodiester phosphodiesterase n=1 Tax=Thiomonas arsenitoxydans (strain DSM 22701 / CIP 110005 / 3As) TaxID=426114 RepID=D6CKK4_THIA3|nr:glycerophosphodiester phosphodiesterase family protein [Thiomonas arsenitoxydans]CAZ87472.1 putative Glycerophosphodiester phosphodiesterase [Thiomonas arsenitoxydans]CQR27244.1 Glycerophosphoryl diester phosphodiesterase [Thiomonas arsenitoxydans]CQR29594.1 Glycerophosphoryl diester phosphodiesterase [Thiomonas arsenitoxydans]CQR29613.1 Glycerophosphoryl diester phosphodiesterase [Thiomonas arsenitoxydans]CQR32917.1 Glycerophosphoryl diester phosphodiesterase [Thiomonas arsenitoxydans]
MTTRIPFDLRWFAHRGGGDAAPENTLAAFEVGFKAGFRAFECDVKLSADGVLWLLHDDTLDRTTDARGPAAPWRWENLQLVDAGSWHSATFKGEPPASLDQVLDFAARHAVWLNLEIKPNPGQDAQTGEAVARRVVQWLADQPSAQRPLLSSFSLAALQAARAVLDALQADVPLAYLVETYDAAALEQAVALGAEGLHTDWQQVTPAVVAAVHARGLKLRAYTVNDANQARALLADGLDGLFTDRLDLPSRL